MHRMWMAFWLLVTLFLCWRYDWQQNWPAIFTFGVFIGVWNLSLSQRFVGDRS